MPQSNLLLLAPLLLLVVVTWQQWPEPDGGALKPMLQFALVVINENVTFDEPFVFNSSVKLNTSVQVNSSEEGSTVSHNTTLIDPGLFILRWYKERLLSQWLLIIAALLCCLQPLLQLLLVAKKSVRQLKQQQQLQHTSEQKNMIRHAGFTAAVAIILLFLAICLIALHAAGRAQVRPLQETEITAATGGDSTLRLQALVRQSTQKIDAIVESAILETNASVIEICKEIKPETVELVRQVVTRLLNLVTDDLQLTPLLTVLDSFMNVIRGIIDGMKNIDAARVTILKPLRRLTVTVENIKDDLEHIISDACTGADRNLRVICATLRPQVAAFVVGVNAEHVDSDSSVAVITLFRKLNVNVTDIDYQIATAKGRLYGFLDMVGQEIGHQFDQLTSQASSFFSLALIEAEDLRRDLRRAADDKEFLRVTGAIDVGIKAGTNFAYIFLAFFVLLLIVCLFYSLKRLSSNLTDSEEGGQEEEENQKSLLGMKSLNSNGAEASSDEINHNHNNENRDNKSHSHEQQLNRKLHPRALHALTAIGCVQLLLLLVYGFALLYAGYELQTDACRYITQPEAIDKLDEMLQQLATKRLWPILQQHLQTLPFELPLQQQHVLPAGSVAALLRDCGKDNLTAAQILNLADALNITQILMSPFVRKLIGEGRRQLLQIVRQQTNSLGTNQFLGEAESWMQKNLPQFASIIDSQDFSSSIKNLQQKLLPTRLELRNFSHSLITLSEQLLSRNSSDRRIVLLQHFAGNVMEVHSDGLKLQPKLQQLENSFRELQESRVMSNLTKKFIESVIQLKPKLLNQTALLSILGHRFDQVVSEFLPKIGQFGQRLLHRFAERVGSCKEVDQQVLQPLRHWCSAHTNSAVAAGFTILAVCALLHFTLLILLLVLPLVRCEATASSCCIYSKVRLEDNQLELSEAIDS